MTRSLLQGATLNQGADRNTRARRARAELVLTALRSIPSRGIGFKDSYPVTTDVPTLNHGTTDTITSGFMQVSAADTTGRQWTPLGTATSTWDATFGYLHQTTNGLNEGPVRLGFQLTGTDVEITWRGAVAGSGAQWIWVDGKPITATPTAPSGLTVTGGGIFRTKLTFATAGVRNIEFHQVDSQPVKIRVPNGTSSITALPMRGPKFFTLGDSYLGGSTLIPYYQTWGPRIGFAAGMETFLGGQGGTGYTAVGTGGTRVLTDASRLDPVVAADPDLVLIFMGGNDTGATSAAVRAAATTVFKRLADGCPRAPVIVAGTFASNATDTLTSVRAVTNKALRDTALAAPNVLGFIDPVGNADTGTVPAGLVNGTAYSVGDRYTFQGAIYRVFTAHTGGASPNRDNTELLTWLTGQSNAGAPDGSGNRDTLLSGDATHWTLTGASVQAQRLTAGCEQILKDYLAA